LVQGEDTLAGWRGGGGSIVRKTPDTALYSINVSTLCSYHARGDKKSKEGGIREESTNLEKS
jgi:hypothetical protein